MAVPHLLSLSVAATIAGTSAYAFKQQYVATQRIRLRTSLYKGAQLVPTHLLEAVLKITITEELVREAQRRLDARAA